MCRIWGNQLSFGSAGLNCELQLGFRPRRFTTFEHWCIFITYLQGRKHEHLLLSAVYLLQQDGPASLFVQLGYSNCVVLEQNNSSFLSLWRVALVLFFVRLNKMCQVSYFWVQVKEDVVLEAEQQLVFVLDVLLHQGARRVQPPVNHSNIRHARCCYESCERVCGKVFWFCTLNCWWLCPPVREAGTAWPTQQAAGLVGTGLDGESENKQHHCFDAFSLGLEYNWINIILWVGVTNGWTQSGGLKATFKDWPALNNKRTLELKSFL